MGFYATFQISEAIFFKVLLHLWELGFTFWAGGPLRNSFSIKINHNACVLGANSNLTYSIPSGIAANAFRIDSISGDVYTLRELNRETRAYYIVTIYSKDNWLPACCATTTLRITKLDV